MMNNNLTFFLCFVIFYVSCFYKYVTISSLLLVYTILPHFTYIFVYYDCILFMGKHEKDHLLHNILYKTCRLRVSSHKKIGFDEFFVFVIMVLTISVGANSSPSHFNPLESFNLDKKNTVIINFTVLRKHLFKIF